jgi:hypothetical protein
MNKTTRIEVLYASLPNISCKGLCSDCCGPIFVNAFEWERMGRPKWSGGSLSCPLLEEKRCSVYDLRPLICRLWGIVPEMPCPWGCKPDREMTTDEVTSAWEEWRQISSTLKGPGLKDIEQAYALGEPRRLVGISK